MERSSWPRERTVANLSQIVWDHSGMNIEILSETEFERRYRAQL